MAKLWISNPFIRWTVSLLTVVYITSCTYFVIHFHWLSSSSFVLRLADPQSTFLPLPSQVSVLNTLKNPVMSKRSSHVYNITNEAFYKSWQKNIHTCCDGLVEVHDRKSVCLRDVVLIPSRASAKASGGEDIQNVINREEKDEFFKYSPGFFVIHCSDENHPLKNAIENKSHFRDWSDAVDYKGEFPVDRNQSMSHVPELTIAVTRYEFANVYWVIMELYDAFLTSQFYGSYPSDANVLLMDAHPKGALDNLWTTTFRRAIPLGSLPHQTTFSQLVWNFPRKFSPFLAHPKNESPHYPLLPHFREFVYNSYNITPTHDLSERCSLKQLNVLFIWRHDYVAHPRNPSGIVERKISNEDELIKQASTAFPSFKIRGVQLDHFDISDQLRMISEADIFVGMHGAAFGFLVLLSPERAAIELWPKNHGGNWHMKALAQANHLHYFSWKNQESKYENTKTKSTHIPPAVIQDLLQKAWEKICQKANWSSVGKSVNASKT